MSRANKVLPSVAILMVAASPAWAACSNPLAVLNGTGISFNMSVANNAADNNCMSNLAVAYWGGAALGTAVAYGSTPTGSAASVNAFVTNTAAINLVQHLGAALSSSNGLFVDILQNNIALGNATTYGSVPTGNALSANAFVTNTASVNIQQILGATLSSTNSMFSNISQWAGTTVGAPAAYGTAPSGNAPGVNAFVTNTASVNLQQTLGSTLSSTNGLFVNILQNNIALGAATTYGSTPTGNALSVNANVTNTNANGQASIASSSPVVLPAVQVTADPCSLNAKTNVAIAQSTTSAQQLVALSANSAIYVCSMFVISGSANTLAVINGTGTNCANGSTAVIGSNTLGTSMSFAANGGFTLGNGGATIAKIASTQELCIVTQTGVMAGNLTYVYL